VIRRFVWAISILAAVFVAGTSGYMLIEGWSFFDSLYMTTITVGTVGFGEVHPLSDNGRLFTMCLIIAGVGALGFAFGQLVEFVFEGRIQEILEGRRMGRRLESLTGHTVVAGFGRVGSVVARALAEEGAQFVIIDLADESEVTARESDWIFVRGDATEEEVLEQAGIRSAASIVTALSSDAENLFVTVTARALNPDVFIVARSSHESTETKLINAGANRTITPNVIGGRRMASMVLHPTVSDYLDIVSSGEGAEFRLQEVELEAESCFVGRTIAEGRIRETTGAQVVAILKTDGTVDANPAAASVLMAGERLVVLGTADQVAVLAEQACPTKRA
jgi:voltage-gated potassium channel